VLYIIAMSMYETIVKTASQFAFEPRIINEENLKKTAGYVVVGMGGSHLAIELIKRWQPELEVISHQNYGLPKLAQAELKKRLIIFSSYSGNTEEVIDSYLKAGEMGLNRAVITVGGKLLELAKKDEVAYIEMPNGNIQPRSALPLSLISFLQILGQKEMLAEVKKLQSDFHPENFEAEGKKLAETLHGRIPVIYTSAQNEILGYIWKINFNETGKIPAFNNVVPELNHNEMNGFGVEKTTTGLSRNFYFLFLSDQDDYDKIKKRMEVTAKLYADRNLPSETITLGESNPFLKVFNSLAMVEFAAYFTAKNYGLEAEQVPMVEEFKKML
jgi:glucose/mannose-6-phosphate isomerase